MSFSRREFLSLGLAGFASTVFTRKANAELKFEKVPPRNTLSIVQGPTDDTMTQFSIVHPQSNNYSFVVLDSQKQVRQADYIEAFTLSGQSTEVSHAFFSQLRPNEDYALQITLDGKVVDQRFFQTLDTEKSKLRFGILSCMHDGYHKAKIWNDIHNQKLDILLFIGDCTYADSVTGFAHPEALWKRFSEARQTLEVYHWPRLIPVFAVWDDHDFGMQNGNSETYPYTAESAKNFLTFFPQNSNYCRFLETGPGIASCLSFRGQKLILMDDRSFRKKRGSKDRFAQWGEIQENWIVKKASEATSTAWLLNGSQYFSTFPFQESVARDHTNQFNGFLEELKKLRTKVIFASGDVHYSELTRVPRDFLGYETLEVTSSSIHSPSLPGSPWIIPNRNRVAGSGKRNYMVVEAVENSYTIQCFSQGNQLEFQRKLQF